MKENLFSEFCINDSSLIFLLNFESFLLDVYKPKVVGMMWSMLAQEQVRAEAGCIFINSNSTLYIRHHNYSCSSYFLFLFRCSYILVLISLLIFLILSSISIFLQTWFGSQPWKSYGIQMVPLTPASELRDDPAWIEEMLPLFEESCMKDEGK